MLGQWLKDRRKHRELVAAKEATDAGPMCPIEVYLPRTPKAESGFLPGTAEEQAAIFGLHDELVDFVHGQRLGVVGGFDFRRNCAFVYVWCNDPEMTLRKISPILRRYPTIQKVQLSKYDFKTLGDNDPDMHVRLPPFD